MALAIQKAFALNLQWLALSHYLDHNSKYTCEVNE